MHPSSHLCRTQEALQYARAAESSLPSVRARSVAAAVAWGREAASAERREQRHTPGRAPLCEGPTEG